MLSAQWPVKIILAHHRASFFKHERLTIAADCTLLSNSIFLDKYRSGEPVVIGCPLLEDPDLLLKKLNLILGESPAACVEVYTMEVPCCHAIHQICMKVLDELGKSNVEAKHYIVRVGSGLIEQYKPGVVDESMVNAERRAHGHIC